MQIRKHIVMSDLRYNHVGFDDAHEKAIYVDLLYHEVQDKSPFNSAVFPRNVRENFKRMNDVSPNSTKPCAIWSWVLILMIVALLVFVIIKK